MRLSEARRLKPGDEVIISGMPPSRRRGTVVMATRKGGVLVKIGESELWFAYPVVNHAGKLVRAVSSSLFWRESRSRKYT